MKSNLYFEMPQAFSATASKLRIATRWQSMEPLVHQQLTAQLRLWLGVTHGLRDRPRWSSTDAPNV